MSNRTDDKNKQADEFFEKLVAVNRVAKVVKGGRRFGFSTLIVVGDGKGKVGFGTGKAKEVPEAIKKATAQAKRNMKKIPLREARTLHHDAKGVFGSGKVILRAAPSGTGIIAGGPMRAVFEALGVQDVVAKALGTTNPHNLIKATLNALYNIDSPKQIALRRGVKISYVVGQRSNA